MNHEKEQTMQEQFSRTELLLGHETMAMLQGKKIAIFGLGGVGGHVCDALARCGIENFVLIDDDKISLTNINRQLLANFTTIGKDKVTAMKEHILTINPNAKIETYKCFFTASNQNQFNFGEYDYVVDAIDTISSKIVLVLKCQENKTPLISSMGAGNKLDPTKFEVADIYQTSVCPLAKVMRYELKRRHVKNLKVVYSKETPLKPFKSISDDLHKKMVPGSISFVPSVVGLIIASEVIKDLIKFNNSKQNGESHA